MATTYRVNKKSMQSANEQSKIFSHKKLGFKSNNNHQQIQNAYLVKVGPWKHSLRISQREHIKKYEYCPIFHMKVATGVYIVQNTKNCK